MCAAGGTLVHTESTKVLERPARGVHAAWGEHRHRRHLQLARTRRTHAAATRRRRLRTLHHHGRRSPPRTRPTTSPATLVGRPPALRGQSRRPVHSRCGHRRAVSRRRHRHDLRRQRPCRLRPPPGTQDFRACSRGERPPGDGSVPDGIRSLQQLRAIARTIRTSSRSDPTEIPTATTAGTSAATPRTDPGSSNDTAPGTVGQQKP